MVTPFCCLNSLNTFKNDCNAAIITDMDRTISELDPFLQSKFKPKNEECVKKLAEKFKFASVLTGREVNDAVCIVKLK